jgi:hypothetical protein
MGMEVKLMVTPKQIGMLGLGSRNLDLVVKKASKDPWYDLGIDALPGAEPRCGCAQLPNRTMFPLLESPCFSTLIMRARRRNPSPQI